MSKVSKEFKSDFEHALAKDFLESLDTGNYDDFSMYKMLNSINDWKDSPYTRAAKLKKKYLDMAFDLIEQGEPAYKAFGMDLAGASKLAAILQKEDEERIAKASLHSHLESAPDNSLTALKTKQQARFNSQAINWNP